MQWIYLRQKKKKKNEETKLEITHCKQNIILIYKAMFFFYL